MRKSVFIFAFCALCLKALSQEETFDMTSYTAPKNWTKEAGNTVVSYTAANSNTGGFCVISIYNSVPGKGSPHKDFQSEWNDLIRSPYGAGVYPKERLENGPDGWKTLVAAENIQQDNLNFSIMLIVFSNRRRAVSVLVKMNDQVYVKAVDGFLATIRFRGKEISGHRRADAESASPASGSNTSIIGIWSDQTTLIGNYVASSGAFISSADVSEMQQYEFHPDNRFTYQFLGSMIGSMLYINSSGSFRISGDQLSLTSEKYITRMVAKGLSGEEKRDSSREITEVYTFFIGPNKWEPGPFLNLHKDGNYYAWSDYPYDYFRKIAP